MAANKKCCRNIDGYVGKKQLFCKLWFAGLACSGLQMCCFVGWISFVFVRGEKKQNKFPSSLH